MLNKAKESMPQTCTSLVQGSADRELQSGFTSEYKRFSQQALELLDAGWEQGKKLPLQRAGLQILLRILGIYRFDSLEKSIGHCPDPYSFCSRLLQEMQINYKLQGKGLTGIPDKGPLVVVSNHPFGGIEAIIICHIISQVRSDLRFLANYLLQCITYMQEMFIPVDPFGGAKAGIFNLGAMKSASRWIRQGGSLCIFPGGEVSHWQFEQKGVADPPWKEHVARLILKNKANVLPLFIHGYNSWLFQYAGMIHPRLRTLLLPRYFLNKKGTSIKVSIGSVISAQVFRSFPSAKVATWYLRSKTYALSEASLRNNRFKSAFPKLLSKNRKPFAVAKQLDSRLLQQDLQNLPREQILLQNNEFIVFEAKGEQIPHILHEIGRQRENTFRMEGEGSKKPLDLDIFDQLYDHLVLWDAQKMEVAGGYRIAKVDQMLALPNGVRNLYTSTLFRYSRGFFKDLQNSLELGRSFVVPAHQKSYSSLLLLWKGIGRYLIKRPQYRYLFGPVSISQDYDHFSVQSLISHLHCNFFQPELACKVKGRRTPRLKLSKYEKSMIESIVHLDTSDLDNIISDMEDSRRRVPVLIKQYLKLGGRILGFHHDRRFGTFDGLIMVDLMQTDRKVMIRFLGKEDAERYLAFHANQDVEHKLSA